MEKILCIATCLLTCGLSNRASAGCNAANANNGSLEVRATGQLLFANQLVYIAGTPTMPTLAAKLTGSPSGTLIWTFDQEFVRGSRNDGPSYTETLSATETWNINGSVDDEFFGGKITIQLEDDDGKICSFTFHIRGTNPSESTVENYIGTSPWYAIPIAKHESDKPSQGRYYCQFNNPANWTPSASGLMGACPNKSSDDIGWGIFQLSVPAPSITELWSWEANVDGGKSKINQAISTADFWMNAPLGALNKPEGGQRVQSLTDLGYILPVPDETVGGVTFKDGTSKPIEDAVAIKIFNSASTHYCYWSRTSKAWGFSRLNAQGFNYVERICAHAN